MRRARLAVAGLCVLAAAGAAPARADILWDVAAARANARAGGPISGYDAELLERWGCLSGTRNAFCKRIERGGTTNTHAGRRRRTRR